MLMAGDAAVVVFRSSPSGVWGSAGWWRRMKQMTVHGGDRHRETDEGKTNK